MDARSVSYTTPSRRGSSRVYLDLTAYHHELLLSKDSSPSLRSSVMMQRFLNPAVMPHIGIVGAGVAGLRCAEVLIRHGFRVTILEGRNRVGGRMHQATLPSGRLVDLGPNWIHGTEHNPILDLAKETETVTHSWEDAATIFSEDGTQLPEEEAKELGGMMWEIVLEAFQESNRNTATISNHISLYDYFENRVKEKFPDGTENSEKNRKLVLQISEMWGAFVGNKIQKQSMKFFWLEECIDGENLFVASTYHKILAQIAKTAVEKADIMFSTRVIKVNASPSKDENTPSKVTVTTDKGEKLDFDEVVMTTPLGWLKKNKSAFEPPLPKRVAKAIDSISYGCLEKIYITFPTAFWNEPIPEIKSVNSWLSNCSSPPVSRPLSRAVSLKNKINPATHTIGFTQWLQPTYALDTNPKQWHQESVNLAALPSSTAHPTLLFYIFGDQSRELSQKLAILPSDADLQSSVGSSTMDQNTEKAKLQTKEQYLTNFFQPYYSLLPNYDSTSPSCTPASLLFTDWVSDDLAGNGSYSNFETSPSYLSTSNEHPFDGGDNLVECEKAALDADIEVLREGLGERGVWFAGEHVSPFVALGTVTGAWWSGEGVAGRLAAAYGLSGSKERSTKAGEEGLAGVEGERESAKDVNFRGFGDNIGAVP